MALTNLHEAVKSTTYITSVVFLAVCSVIFPHGFRSEVEIVAQERDALVKKLMEAEVDAKSASHMVLKLKDTVNKLNEVSDLSLESLHGYLCPICCVLEELHT